MLINSVAHPSHPWPFLFFTSPWSQRGGGGWGTTFSRQCLGCMM